MVQQLRNLPNIEKRAIIALLIFVFVLLPAYYFFGRITNASDGKQMVIEIVRGPCDGICPVYRRTIYGSGFVIHFGRSFTDVRLGKISEGDMIRIKEELERIGFFSFDSEYQKVSLHDYSNITISVNLDGKYKTIEHYRGDLTAPKELTSLEDMLENLTSIATGYPIINTGSK